MGSCLTGGDLGRIVSKRSIAAATLAALVSSSTFAADMPLGAPPAPPAVFSWTGFYGGVNVGYGWSNSNNTWNIFGANFGCPTATGDALCIAGADSDHMKGVLGGQQIGYNWQTGRYVFGIETDFDATGQTNFPWGKRRHCDVARFSSYRPGTNGGCLH
jgi:outer membrane immunogenic protein